MPHMEGREGRSEFAFGISFKCFLVLMTIVIM